MRNSTIAALAFVAFLVPLAKADTILFIQGPPNGNSYDITDYRLADSFMLSGPSLLDGIDFWYQAQQETDLSVVTYAIYEDNVGALGASVQSETISAIVTSFDPSSGLFFASFQATQIGRAHV